MGVLGVSHEVLGADADRGRLSRWRDSGMAGTPSADDPGAPGPRARAGAARRNPGAGQSLIGR
jgi:hypothetical protein